jgi:hypothetical protein
MAYARTREAGALRLYRGLLFACPAAFRDEYGRELCLAFADRCRDTRSLADMALVCAEAIFGILIEAPKEHLHMILQDFRYAVRILRKDWPVTAAAIAILALGIGSTTLIFSLANGRCCVRCLTHKRTGGGGRGIQPQRCKREGADSLSQLLRFPRAHAAAGGYRRL